MFFSSRSRHTRSLCDWSSDVCSSDLMIRRPRDHCVTGVQTCALPIRSEEHTSELQSHSDLVCRLLLEKKKTPSLLTRRQWKNLFSAISRLNLFDASELTIESHPATVS